MITVLGILFWIVIKAFLISSVVLLKDPEFQEEVRKDVFSSNFQFEENLNEELKYDSDNIFFLLVLYMLICKVFDIIIYGM